MRWNCLRVIREVDSPVVIRPAINLRQPWEHTEPAYPEEKTPSQYHIAVTMVLTGMSTAPQRKVSIVLHPTGGVDRPDVSPLGTLRASAYHSIIPLLKELCQQLFWQSPDKCIVRLHSSPAAACRREIIASAAENTLLCLALNSGPGLLGSAPITVWPLHVSHAIIAGMPLGRQEP